MMDYIYSDEDNNPMIGEEPWRKYTTYSCKAEADYYENGGYEADQEAKENAYEELKKERMDAILDKLGLEGGCRECPYVVEWAEGFLGDDGQISNEQYEYLEGNCKLCVGQGGGNGTGIVPEKVQGWIDHEWNDRLDWAKNNLPRMSCAWCPNAFRIYGQYKDPDDEWKATEELCGKCKLFVEG